MACALRKSHLFFFPMELTAKHAVVTGSGKRLGRAIAESLLRKGMNLTAHYFQSSHEVDSLVQWAKSQNLGNVIPVQADLRKTEDIFQLGKYAQETIGPADLLVHSASDFYPTEIDNTTPEAWDALMSLNLKAAFFLTQQFVQNMPVGSQVIFIADVHGSKPIARYSPYCASKAGLIALAKTLSRELAPRIRVNCISPGTVLPQDNATSEEIERAARRSLLGKVGNPKDIVEGLHFLCRNDYITGFDLIIDGGRSLI